MKLMLNIEKERVIKIDYLLFKVLKTIQIKAKLNGKYKKISNFFIKILLEFKSYLLFDKSNF